MLGVSACQLLTHQYGWVSGECGFNLDPSDQLHQISNAQSNVHLDVTNAGLNLVVSKLGLNM
jgi:hypothetical protein